MLSQQQFNHLSDKLTGDAVGVAVVRNDFLDPQGGKGVCDRKATTIKGDVGRYVNEGNDVINALQLKTATESGQGTTGVKASYVAAQPSSTFNIRELKKTTTATAAATSLNKRFNEQNSGCVRTL